MILSSDVKCFVIWIQTEVDTEDLWASRSYWKAQPGNNHREDECCAKWGTCSINWATMSSKCNALQWNKNIFRMFFMSLNRTFLYCVEFYFNQAAEESSWESCLLCCPTETTLSHKKMFFIYNEIGFVSSFGRKHDCWLD